MFVSCGWILSMDIDTLLYVLAGTCIMTHFYAILVLKTLLGKLLCVRRIALDTAVLDGGIAIF